MLLPDLADAPHGAGLECVVKVRDEEDLEEALEHLDPEIFLLSAEDADDEQEPLDRLLELLPDVPAGKLAIADLSSASRADVEELERAGVDAVVVAGDATSAFPPDGDAHTRVATARRLRACWRSALAVRAVGAGYGLPLPLLNPDEAQHRPARLGSSTAAASTPAGTTTRACSCSCSRRHRRSPAARRTGPRASSRCDRRRRGSRRPGGSARRAYGTAAAVVGAGAVAVATTHVAYSRMAVTDVLLTLGCTVALALDGLRADRVGRARGRARRVREVPRRRRCSRRSSSRAGGDGPRSRGPRCSRSPASR